MTALPTVGRVVLLRMSHGITAPALVVSVTDSGALNVVAFSDWWALTAAKVFRNVPAFDSLPADAIYEAAWQWPPRIDPPAGMSSAEVSRELAREQLALASVLASLRERVDLLAAASTADAEAYLLLERRVAALERQKSPA